MIGIYHQLNSQSLRSSWIFLEVRQSSYAQLLTTAQSCLGQSGRSIEIHLILLASTEVQWEEYIEYLERQLSDFVSISDRILGQFIFENGS